jgi:shikimate dehydrogenase
MRAAGLEHYQRLPVPPELLAETVRGLPGAGFRGANVTIPHKEAALALADAPSATAREIGAANTLIFEPDGTIAADNTDAPGLMAALGRAPASALVLGAGGSARAVVWALQRAGADVAVWNRTPARAAALGARVVQRPEPAEVLVNCTSVGLDGSSTPFKDLPLTVDSLEEYATVVDLVYRRGGTALIREAARRGLTTVDGLEILVRQGAASFTLWTGRAAPLDAMRTAVRDPGPDHGAPRLPDPTPPDRPAS